VGWTPWSDWGTCSSTCGTGAQRRTRYCQNTQASSLNNNCDGESSEYRTCVEVQCSSTYSYSNCKYISIFSNQNTYVIVAWMCIYVDHFNRFDNNCIFTNVSLVGWTLWSAWDACSLTCGTGVQQRSRDCHNPLASALSNSCAGNNIDFRTCSSYTCKTYMFA